MNNQFILYALYYNNNTKDILSKLILIALSMLYKMRIILLIKSVNLDDPIVMLFPFLLIREFLFDSIILNLLFLFSVRDLYIIHTITNNNA